MYDFFSVTDGMPVVYADITIGKPKRAYTPERESFTERAKREIKEELKPEEKYEEIIATYSVYGAIDHTCDPEKMLKLSLSGQDYIISRGIMRVISCCDTAVFYKKKLLWTTRMFDAGVMPQFLNKKLLKDQLSSVFKNVNIRLGELCHNYVKYIVWQVETEKGTFVIPWHNACLLRQTENMLFTEKSFKEVRLNYKMLRFTEFEKNVFKVLCG